MKKMNLMKKISVMLAAMLSFSSCNVVWDVEEDMDVSQSIKFAGQWTGDFGMYYTYRYGNRYYTFDSYDTDIVFYPEYNGATYGYGKQVDYYEHGPYAYIYNSFDWEILNGVVYLQYYSDSSLDCAIYDYRMTAYHFQGRFGSSNEKFFLTKIADYYDWGYYSDYYYYYTNNDWHWSSGYARQMAPARADTDSTMMDNKEEAQEKDGIVSFGKRI